MVSATPGIRPLRWRNWRNAGSWSAMRAMRSGWLMVALGEALQFLRGDFSLGGGDGSPCGSTLGCPRYASMRFKDFVGDRVFEVLGFVVDFGPVQAEDLDEEELDEAVAAEDVEGQLFAGPW